MQDIKELVQILDANHFSNLNGLNLMLDKGSKLGLLYQGISSGKIVSDEDAQSYLFNSTVENGAYRKLKSTLREYLLDTLCHLNIDSGGYTDYQKAYFDCHKKWAQVKILTGKNANLAAMSLATKLLKQTIKYDFVHLSMDITSYLRLQYALREPNDKKFQEANQQFTYWRDVYNAECFVEELYTFLIVKSTKTRECKEGTNQSLQNQSAHIAQLLQKYNSYRLHLYGRLTSIMHHNANSDYDASLGQCEDAIRFLESKPYEMRGGMQIFLYEKLACHTHLRQYEEGGQTIVQLKEYIKAGTFNWFKTQELFVRISLHAREYQTAFDILAEVTRHRGYQFLPESVKEIWRVYEAYLHFLSSRQLGVIPKGQRFKLSKFLNETPISSKDKTGMNIAIKVIQVVLMLEERKYTILLEEAESLKQYCYQYLKAPETQRSFLFLKMLFQVSAGHFDQKEVEKRTDKYWQKLKQLPVSSESRYEDVEIIPFEHLWPMIVAMLSK